MTQPYSLRQYGFVTGCIAPGAEGGCPVALLWHVSRALLLLAWAYA